MVPLSEESDKKKWEAKQTMLCTVIYIAEHITEGIITSVKNVSLDEIQ